MIRHYLILFIAIFIFYSIQNVRTARKYQPPPRYLLRPKNIHCEGDNETVLIKYCSIRAYSRLLVTTSLGVKILSPLTKPFYIQLIIKYRYGIIYHQVIDTKQIEWCSVMDGSDTNPLIKMLNNLLKEVVPHLFKKCPYEGELDFVNFTVNNGEISDI